MGDTALYRQLPQALEQFVGRAAHMQDYGQVEPARQLKLRAIELLLPGWVQAGHEVIQANLSDGHQTLVSPVLLQFLRQQLQICVVRAPCVKGVNAQRIAIAMPMGQGAHRGPVAALHRRNHTMGYALGPRLGTHGIAVGVKFGRIQVAMGIDPDSHGVMMPHQPRPLPRRETLQVHSAAIRANVKTVRRLAASSVEKVTGCPGPPSTAAPATPAAPRPSRLKTRLRPPNNLRPV
ncbi:hypothetical protein D3C72_1633600 [compost metagenome]